MRRPAVDIASTLTKEVARYGVSVPNLGSYADVRASLDKAKALGGSIVLEPAVVPGRELTIARIADLGGMQIGARSAARCVPTSPRGRANPSQRLVIVLLRLRADRL